LSINVYDDFDLCQVNALIKHALVHNKGNVLCHMTLSKKKTDFRWLLVHKTFVKGRVARISTIE